MRRRIGFIFALSGIILLCEPTIDQHQIMESMNSITMKYWPAILIFIGLVLVNPKKKRNKGKSR